MTAVFYTLLQRSDADLQVKLDEAFEQGLSVGDSDNTEAAYDRGFEAGKRVTAEHLTATKLAEMKAQRDDAMAREREANYKIYKSYSEGFNDGRRGMMPEGKHLEVPGVLELGGFEKRSKLLTEAFQSPMLSMTGEELRRLVAGISDDVEARGGATTGPDLRAEISRLKNMVKLAEFQLECEKSTSSALRKRLKEAEALAVEGHRFAGPLNARVRHLERVLEGKEQAIENQKLQLNISESHKGGLLAEIDMLKGKIIKLKEVLK